MSRGCETASKLRPAIVGVGNILMGDDGVGPAVIELLRRRDLSGHAELLEAGLAFSEILCDLDHRQPLVVIDAVRGGGLPGSIYRLGLDDLTAESGSMAAAVSLHEVSILPALQMEALAGRQFTDVTIFGVEADKIAWGEGLSVRVTKAADKLVQIICDFLIDRAACRLQRQASAACGS